MLKNFFKWLFPPDTLYQDLWNERMAKYKSLPSRSELNQIDIYGLESRISRIESFLSQQNNADSKNSFVKDTQSYVVPLLARGGYSVAFFWMSEVGVPLPGDDKYYESFVKAHTAAVQDGPETLYEFCVSCYRAACERTLPRWPGLPGWMPDMEDNFLRDACFECIPTPPSQ